MLRRLRIVRSTATAISILARPAIPVAVPSSEPYRSVFVGGAQRSGTSWVQDVLAQAPGVVTSPESHVFERLHARLAGGPRRLRSILAIVWGFDTGPGRTPVGLHRWITRDELVVILREAAVRGRNPEEAAGVAVRRVFDCFVARHADRSRNGSQVPPVLVEKTPSNVHHAAAILDVFPDATFVQVIRDGRDVCVSHDKRSIGTGWRNTDRAAQAKLWRSAVEAGRAVAADPRYRDRVVTIRYERMRADPVGEAARLFEATGLDAPDVASAVDATRIERHEGRGDGRHRRRGAVGDWRTELSDDDLAVIAAEVGPLLADLGYT